MKPILLYLPVFIICILFVFVLPHFVHFPNLRGQALPVSVTSLGQATPVIDSPWEGLAENEEPGMAYGSLEGFIASVANGQGGQVVGVYVPGLFAMPVVQQPSGQPEYVDRDSDILTEFSLPKKYGSTGLLAHNYLGGSYFALLKANQDVLLVYGDGHMEQYRVSHIDSFQALKPNSPFSNFVDIADPSHTILTSGELFSRMYTSQQLVFQTCIEAFGEPSWGRLFITASLVKPLNLGVPSIVGVPTSN